MSLTDGISEFCLKFFSDPLSLLCTPKGFIQGSPACEY